MLGRLRRVARVSGYGVKQVFGTVQGEGARAGTRAVFVRFTGCNMWSGDPSKREVGDGACAKWCDTDFFKGSVLTLAALLARMDVEWPADETPGDYRWCVLSGGEPCLQIDQALLNGLHASGWHVAVETNGTVANEAVTLLADWVCIAPKLLKNGSPSVIALPRANEVKVVLPGVVGGVGWTREMMRPLERLCPNDNLFVQPMDPLLEPTLVSQTALLHSLHSDPQRASAAKVAMAANEAACLAFVKAHPRWRLGAQLHKHWGVP